MYGASRLFGLEMEVEDRNSYCVRPRMSSDSLIISWKTLLYLLYMASSRAPMIPLDKELRPTWLFGNTVHEGCDRGGFYEQAQFAEEYGSPLCIVKLGCWGPVSAMQCRETRSGWAGLAAAPMSAASASVDTMPSFPDKFMPFMNQPPG